MIPFHESLLNYQRLYVIGDIHGCDAELDILIEFLTGHEKITNADQVVFIGDYIDRGLGSKRVIEALLLFKTKYPATWFLKGNHEIMLEYFLKPGEEFPGNLYLQNGGERTIAGYGVEASAPVEEVKRDLGSAIPQSHHDFFKSLINYVITPQYVFAHAGMNPLRDLRLQVEEDIFWIRDEFILNIHHFERMVVFGHTPFQKVMFHLPYKIGIDTGLVYGNRLSCVELKERKIIQVKQGEERVKIVGWKN